MRAIAQNAGFEGSVVVEHVKALGKGEGLNCATGEYGNMIAMGVNDPVKVTRTALESAASVAALILITEQMKIFLTRLGFGSKMVVTGDATQSDIPRNASGLKDIRSILFGIEDIAFCDLKIGRAHV